MDILKTIFAAQRELNIKTLEKRSLDYDALCKDNNEVWILKYSRAQIHESIEFEREFNWKHWKTPTPVDWDAAREEAIDELHFWVSKCQLLGMTPEDILKIYLRKNSINHERQKQGY